MSRSRRSATEEGFTIIELMLVVAIAAVLTAVAAPSFAEFLSKRRVDGVMAELVTDLQYARSEAVGRNAPVRVTFGSDKDCYVIHLASAATAECTRNSSTVAPTTAEIKSVHLDADRGLTIDPGALVYLEFDPVRGTAVNSAAATSGSVIVRSISGPAWELRALLTLMGRVATCSPGGAGKVVGYSDCS